MNERFDSRGRTPWDVVQFAITFFGLLIAGAGIVATSPSLATIGFILAVWGVGYFLIKRW
ncbi:MAG: hypothetical protein HY735_10860 [Verrucomicrobia bacterium]|nr:hypothetical protein [Verrucomicrobiota bacterium]